ncbi:hypothetical protein A8924_2640 [Saccharopolyspora erythraea NRRL 2338]|uniref:Uncharacterized protein n=2 Tax=Saccharopolyspora erythraea TaxID=1836 RepID=A4FBX5_SACEN|nr:hypothetical protein [Saccharopolyspora erythraea]EQD82673.1 hypothetical protein N599_29325 [Saccharopolyspora erythraea D]PFG95322.1 hypothetical protein A8924_2640 [Saccharopolyspora erythraea NRRL 2338]QRK91966.1 hypothetical protein JQX30_11755 [Saccharopolyspora erythraea]CAM01550.1 hypothetical protein SACE_2245 [Saccharopolyspora erythraea NRRL 2338]
MTYPPQQPGPGGWGQQPAGGGIPAQGPQQPPQQQPAWYGNQHTGWGQPGQQAQPTQQVPAFGQQTPPQAPDWGGEFGPGSWIQEPGGFADVEPPRRKSKLPWILGGAGAVVVAGGVAAGLFYFMGGGPGEARPAAQAVVDKVNAHDFAWLADNLCQANHQQLKSALNQLEPWQFDIRLGQVTEQGDQATAKISGTYVEDGVAHPVEQTMGLSVEDGQWKLCKLEQ